LPAKGIDAHDRHDVKGFEMMKTLLLICSLGTAQPDCSVATAEAVIDGPDAMSLVACGLHGQAYIADGAIAGYLDGAHYLKVTCTSGPLVRAPAVDATVSAKRSRGRVQTMD
jgi:hypothetical protein